MVCQSSVFGFLQRRWKVMLITSVLLTGMTFFFFATNGFNNGAYLYTCTDCDETTTSRLYSIWPQFSVDPPSSEALGSACGLDSLKSITYLLEISKHLKTSRRYTCRSLYKKLTDIYIVEMRIGRVSVPVPFSHKVKHWLGNNETLYMSLLNQEIIHVINRYTKEATVFNPLRDKRPVTTKSKESDHDYLQRITKESAMNCDFCNFKNSTAQDMFGRLESNLSYTASNIFKLDSWHAVVSIKEHNPVNWSFDQYMDMMRLSLTWLEKAHSHDDEAVYPSIIWDLLPKSGASQIHPHNQVFLSPHRYHGMVESWRQAGQEYYTVHGKNYFSSLVTLHTALGLSVHHKSAVALASLTPRKNNEVIILAPTANDDFFELIYFVLRAFMDDLKKYSFSLGGGFPAIGVEHGTGNVPAFVRVITRGVLTEIRTDITALELFTISNVNIDPFKVTQSIAESVRKRSKDIL